MTQIKLRRDTSAAFASSNPILGNGEPAYETDTKKLKIGDGTTAYTQLEYFSTGGGGSAPTNMVTTDTAQTITGHKSFSGELTIDKIDGNYGLYISTHPLKGAIRFGNTERDVIIAGKGITTEAGDKFLTSGDKETIMGYMTPDFDSGIDVPLNEEYICPYSGYFILQANSTGNMARAELFVYKSDGSFFNAFQCAPNYGGGTDSGAFVAIQLSKGTKIKATIPTANKSHYSILFPFKGGLNNA